MKPLTEIGIRLGTDKAEYHQFTEFYQEYFDKLAELHEKPKILEIGIANGESLKMYDEFFQNKAEIYGVDTVEKGHLFPANKSIKTLRGDILKADTIEKIKNFAGEGFDIIIDDGGHTMEQQQKALLNLWPLLKPGGYFVIEDLHTSSIEDYNPDKTTSTLLMLKGLEHAEYHESLYINEQTLKELDAEMESVIICENDFPQVGTQQPRMSITSMIVKKETEGVRIAREAIEAAKTPTIKHNLGGTDENAGVFDYTQQAGTVSNTNPVRTIEEPQLNTSPGTVTDKNPVKTITHADEHPEVLIKRELDAEPVIIPPARFPDKGTNPEYRQEKWPSGKLDEN